MKYIVDSNIFIDALNGDIIAKTFLSQNQNNIRLSYIVYFEVIVGAKNKKTYIKIQKLLNQYPLETGNLATILKAIELVDYHLLKDGIQLFDALITATAIVNSYTLVTRDLKHMSKIDGLKIKKI